ncbi:MAG TPA: hypothetical protein GX513_05860 [Firmicutes bacterium]|nr:hypothetical protein [Bacillota bacterium]
MESPGATSTVGNVVCGERIAGGCARHLARGAAAAVLEVVDLTLGLADCALGASRKLGRELARRGAGRREKIAAVLTSLAKPGRFHLATQADLDRLASQLAGRAEIERLEAKLGTLEGALRGQA